MSTLEDKLLGEKKEYYCSSSESENEQESDAEDEITKTVEVDTGPPPLNPTGGGCSSNTGPKGVIRDWEQFKQIKEEHLIERERERLALIHKLAFTCKSDIKSEEEDLDDAEISELLDESFLLEYSKKRMEEMFNNTSRKLKYGRVFNLISGQEFLDAVDKETGVTVIIHIYEETVLDCRNMNSYLTDLSKEYPDVKFCKLLASNAGVSKQFKISGVPALLVYRNGALIGNFVKITQELGTEFSFSDVENFLIENGILLDKTFLPTIISETESKGIYK